MKAIFGAILNFLDFWPYAFIISKKNCLLLFELIKDEATLKVQDVLVYNSTTYYGNTIFDFARRMREFFHFQHLMEEYGT